jgi:2-dehydro-3-deoxy-D-arabinonate dehydratase
MIIRYRQHGETGVGLTDGHRVFRIGDELAPLLQLSVADLRRELENAATGPAADREEVELLAPVDRNTEIWAAGVTYQTSRSARMAESERSADVYEQIYDADRPEIFFKSVAWRAVPDQGQVRCRSDSSIDVPEPELALAVNSLGQIVGYGICNDMSSRSIEAANPLYLPQAKIYTGSCALGPGVKPVWEVPDPYALPLHCTIERAQTLVWQGTASTSQLHRQLDDLVGWLFRELEFPDGVWLSTGTCLVPDLPFSLADGDVVTVGIGGVGTLSNTVRRVARL